MTCDHRLDRAFKNAPVLPLNPDSRYVLFSDCHRGNGTQGDNFLKNQHLYSAALNHYYKEGFTYIELGDGDELWENRNVESIKEVHCGVFWQLSRFYRDHRLYMLYGNHDMVKKYPSFTEKKCSDFVCLPGKNKEPLFPGIRFYAGIILRSPDEEKSLYLTHGHQASILNSSFWRLGCFLVRYVWKPLELIGFLDPTSAAKKYTVKQRAEKKLDNWARSRRHLLITGHTHRPILEPAPALYVNTGSCVHPRCVTCMEVCRSRLSLVKWYMGTRENGNFYLEKETLAEREI